MIIIHFHGLELRAAVCPICNGRIYPVTDLPAHELRHKQIYEPVMSRVEGKVRWKTSWTQWQSEPGMKY